MLTLKKPGNEQYRDKEFEDSLSDVRNVGCRNYGQTPMLETDTWLRVILVEELWEIVINCRKC